MARKTFKGSGFGDGGWFLVPGLVCAIVGFCVFAPAFIGARADGGADSNASESMHTSVLGMGLPVVIAVVIAAGLAFARLAARYLGVVARLQAWAAQHGWEVTDDMALAAHWATRFHFSEDDLTTPLHAARGRVHGRDAMILFYTVGTEKDPRRTIIVVDADADYPVTAVVRPRSANSHDYGSAFLLESIEFDRRWRAMGHDAAGSHAIFTPRVIERLLEPTPGGQPEIVWDGPGIRADDAGFIADPVHLESRLLLLADLAGLTPAYQVTHTNDDPSLRPPPPPTLRIPGAAALLIALGVSFWFVGQGLAGLVPTASGLWVEAVSVVIGLALIIRGVHLTRLSRARQMREWRAAQVSALGPPPTDRPPSGTYFPDV